MRRLKHSFSSGEVSPLIYDRVDFERYKTGCRKLYNAICLPQGPAQNRSGTKFLYDLTALGLDPADPRVREVPFIFSATQRYVLIFFIDTEGDTILVFGTDTGLVVFGATPSTECPPGTAVTPASTPGDVVALTLPADFDLEAFDWAQSADEMYFTQTGLEPHILKRYAHDCWTISDATTGMTNAPADWSDTNGWPERVTFHQQRLVFAASLLRGQTVWLSRAGDFTHFGQDDPATLVDADAVTFTLNSGTQNRIVWIASGKALFAGTLADEWTVQGSTQSALTPSNILALRQTNNGSESNKPLLVNLSTLFIERHGRTINEFVYDYTYDSYKTSDLSIASTHVTDNYSIVDWSFQRTPDSIIWCVRADGDLLGLTFQREHKVIGWHHHDTLGAFKAVTVLPGNDREDAVFFIVKRIIDGDDKYFFEMLAPRFNADEAEWGRFLDSHKVYQGTAISTMTGLTHLIGEEVTVLADGLVLPPVTVSGTGTVALGAEYSHVVCGLPYTSIIDPILPDQPSDRNGSSLGSTTRIHELSIDFYRSLGCTIGRVDDEGEVLEEYLPFRMPYDVPLEQTPLFSGWYVTSFLEGHTQDPNYYIKQTQPLPMTIRAVVDEYEETS